jgi:hypothetical protein
MTEGRLTLALTIVSLWREAPRLVAAVEAAAPVGRADPGDGPLSDSRVTDAALTASADPHLVVHPSYVPDQPPPKFSDLPVMRWQDMERLYEAIKDPEARNRIEALERLRREWEADKLKLDAERRSLREGFWHEQREFLIWVLRLLKDGLYFIVVWMVLWLVKWVTHSLPLSGRLAETLETAHVVMVVAMYGVLCVAVVWDTIEARLLRRVRPAKSI